MPYQFVENKSEAEYRTIFEQIYCDCQNNPIYTCDGILVKFYPNQFEHAFYESKNWKKRDKSIFSLNRASKITYLTRNTPAPAIDTCRFPVEIFTRDHSFDRIIMLKANLFQKFDASL